MSDMIETEVISEGISLEEAYLKGLYEAYETFQADHRTLHKRSKMHNKETIGEYYLRWKNRMREEIRRMEKLVSQLEMKVQDISHSELASESQTTNIRYGGMLKQVQHDKYNIK